YLLSFLLFFFSSRRRHTRSKRDWSSDVCSSDLDLGRGGEVGCPRREGGDGLTLGLLGEELHHQLLHGVELAVALEGELHCAIARSEERRVGKECRWRVWREEDERNQEKRGGE